MQYVPSKSCISCETLVLAIDEEQPQKINRLSMERIIFLTFWLPWFLINSRFFFTVFCHLFISKKY